VQSDLKWWSFNGPEYPDIDLRPTSASSTMEDYFEEKVK
jgi:hypothetical protein